MLSSFQGDSGLFQLKIKDQNGALVDPYIFSDIEVYIVHSMTQDILARFKYVDGNGWGKLNIIEDAQSGEEYLEFRINDNETAMFTPGLYQVQVKTVQPSGYMANGREVKTYMANLMNINPAKTKYDADI